MTDFLNVASGSFVPSSAGRSVGISTLPGGSGPISLVPMRVYVAHLGNFGTGNPVGKGQVQLLPNGAWYDIAGATITDNGSSTFYAYGLAVRWSIPTLTAPGTGATAPRVAFNVENLQCHTRVGRSAFANDAGTTGEVLSLPGYGRLNPNTPYAVPASAYGGFGTLVFLTSVGSGTAFIESTFVDGDGSFEIQEGATLTSTGQVAVVSFAEEFHVDFTDGAGTTDLYLNTFAL